MYTPLEVLLGSDGARRLARSALPDAPVAPIPDGAGHPRAGGVRRRAGAALRRAAEVIEPEVVRQPADHCGGEPARG